MRLYSLIDTTITNIIEEFSKDIQGLTTVITGIGTLLLTAWVIWQGYSIFIGSIEGEVGPFLQRMVSKYLFLFAACGMGFTAGGLIKQAFALQESTIALFSAKYGNAVVSENKSNSPFTQIDNMITNYVTTANIYLMAKGEDVDKYSMQQVAKDCSEYQRLKAANDEKWVEKASSCATLALVNKDDLREAGLIQFTAFAPKAERDLKEYLGTSVPIIQPVFPGNTEGGWAKFIVFYLKCLVLAAAYYLYAFGEAVIGFFLLLPVIANRIFFAMSLMVAPIFIFCGAWDKTKGYFNSWLNVTLGYAFALPLITLGVGFLLTVKVELLNILRRETAGGSIGDFGVALLSIPISFVLAALMLKIGDLASSYFGGGSVATAGAEGAGAAIRGAAGRVARMARGKTQAPSVNVKVQVAQPRDNNSVPSGGGGRPRPRPNPRPRGGGRGMGVRRED